MPDARPKALPPTSGAAHGGDEGAFFSWWRARGPATQGAIPGAYAWAVTVAPVGWGAASSAWAMVATAVGLALVLIAPALDGRAPALARLGLGWGLVAAAAATWTLAPAGLVDRFDAARGIAGMFGWGLFALAVASPTRPPSGVARADSPEPRKPGRRGDMVALVVGLGLAVALQVPGWSIEARDRALFVRLAAIAGGLGLVTTASAVGTAGPEVGSRRRRMKATDILWVAAASLLLGAGVAYQVWHGR